MTDRGGGPWFNVGCGMFRAPEPWVNLDVLRSDDIDPDIVVEAELDPLAGFEPAGRVYLGHVLEHVPWAAVPILLSNVRAAMAPDGGEVCVVGPDVYRVIESGDRARMRSTLEDDESYQHESGVRGDWDEARHWWNCYEARVVRALERSEFEQVEAVEVNPVALEGWPVTSFDTWQCAVTARRGA